MLLDSPSVPVLCAFCVGRSSPGAMAAAIPRSYRHELYWRGANGGLMLGETLYDVEWNNHTSFVFTLDSNRECTVLQFPVGILRPDWLAGANYLGHRYKDGFLCNVWEKVDFIWYYEDVDTKIPVYWEFYDGLTEHVMKFEVGRVLEDSKWQAPAYCFGDAVDKNKSLVPNLGRHHLSRVGKSYKQYTLLFS
nr:uncharacterized protein At4g14100-like [Ipomoea batatas]